MIEACLRELLRLCFRLRYRVRVTGLAEIASRGVGGILFLPNHPALIDPFLVGTVLHRRFRPRFLADRDQVDRFFVRWLCRRIGVLEIPDLARAGPSGKAETVRLIEACVEALARGENVVLYPAGHLQRARAEDLGAASAVERVLARLPSVRVVLLRTTGLWGSRFGWASGSAPRVGEVLRRCLWAVVCSGVFFVPRRRVAMVCREPADLPRDGDRETLNRYLESFYNAESLPNTYVPYTPWEGAGPRQLPEPVHRPVEGDLTSVPASTRELVIDYLEHLTGVSCPGENARLAHDLGLDSLAKVDLLLWLSSEFGYPPGDVESVQTVGDVLLAAHGQGLASGAKVLRRAGPGWFAAPRLPGPIEPPEGATIPEAFLRQARRQGGRCIAADQAGGEKTYRDLLTAVCALRPLVAQLPGERIGIMLPASCAADVCFLALLFAGKTPVMVNWTVGSRHITHGLEITRVERVLTARALTDRLESYGIELGAFRDRLVCLETLTKGITTAARIRARLRAVFGRNLLRGTVVPETAVVLFTSGSESLPKAVPLSHGHILANVRDIARVGALRREDRLLGILPPFHSFGLTVGTVVPLCAGVPVLHHPDPLQAAVLAQLIQAFGITVLLGTPTFLGGIARAASSTELGSVRILVTGAEKCPDRLYDALAERCPGAVVLEGYGITECAPVVAVNRPEHPVRGSVGPLLPSLEAAIVDAETGGRLPPGRAGMLLVRGPSVFDGYLAYEGPSPFVEFEGRMWYRTGDLVLDPGDGILRFVGRLKRFVKLGGEMISLPAVETALLEVAGGDDGAEPALAVVATETEQNPELVLFTSLDLDRETANRQLRNAGLSPLHNVRRVVRVDSLPVLGTGKVDYRALQQRLREDA